MDLNFSDPEQIKQLISALEKLLPNNSEEEENDDFSSKIKTKTTRAKSNKKKNSNKFLGMPEMRMHKEDSLIDKKLIKAPPTPRTRKFEPINVQCRVCGKKEKVSPSVIPESIDRYKCNKCSGAAGG